MLAPRVVGSLIWSLALSIFLFACGDNITTNATGLSVSPESVTVTVGGTANVTATYRERDGSTAPAITATWSSDNEAVATVVGTGNGQATVTGVTTGTANITATGEGFTASIAVTVSSVGVTSIAITPPMPQLAVGTTQQLTATATFADNTTSDVTASATWTSTDPSVATVSAAGVVSGVAAGTSEITAAYGGAMGTVTVTVSVAHVVSIAVTPTDPSIAAGSTQQMTAMGTFSDTTVQDITAQVAWTSGTPAVATVGGNTGTVVGVTAGTSVITATLGAVSGNTTVTVTPAVLVSIDVEPTLPSISVGTTQQFTATGLYSDGTHQDLTATATWSSGTTAVATINASGVATGVSTGTSTITATSGAISGATVLTVTTAVLVSIDVEPTLPTVAAGLTKQFSATGTYSDLSTHDITTQVTWSSSATAAATISNAAGTQGLATSVAPGATTITATLGGVMGTQVLTVTAATLVSIDVTPTNPSIALGLTKQFTAMGTFTDGTTQDLTTTVVWSSGTEATATVSNAAGTQGLATSVAVGTSAITATSGAISGATVLTVTAAALASIDVTPTNPSVPLLSTAQLTATGTYTDGTHADITTSVTWASSNPLVAAVSNAAGSKGLVTGLLPGASTMSATLGAITGSTTVTVTTAVLVSIEVDPTNPTVFTGTTQQFTAVGTYSDGTTGDLTTQVTWSSSATSTAVISNAAGSQGLATGVAMGTSTISATLGGVTGSTTLTVQDAVLVSLSVTPPDPSIAVGTTEQFTATGTYSDGSTHDITTSVTWSSSATSTATISNAAGSNGLATAVDAGTVTITATLGAVSGSTTLTGVPVTLVSIAVTPANPSIAKGLTQQFTATGTYSDGSTQDLTATATWASATTATATISNAAGTQGLATSVDVGTSVISATSGAVTGSTTLTVTAAVIVSIAVTPLTATVAPNGTQQFVATATLSDGSTSVITAQAGTTWASSATGTATVSNASGTQGLATGVTAGTVSITATSGAIVGTASLTVSSLTVSLLPLDGATGIRTTMPITATFNAAVASATVTVQAANGPCTGDVQLSADNFTTCIGAATAFDATNKILTVTPAATLTALTVYKVKVTTGVATAAGATLAADFAQPNGWTTATDGTCASALVISQVYGGGGNSGAQYKNDFVELHNAGAGDINLNGLSIAYASATGTTWNNMAVLPNATIHAGQYYLIQLAGGAIGAALPTPDFTPTGGTSSFNMSATNGKIALVEGTTQLPNVACPIQYTLDIVSFGTGNCFEGSAAVAVLSNTTAAIRGNAGCTDANANSTDFSVAAPAPRNTATTANTCSCPAPQGSLAEVDYCNLQFPLSTSANAGDTTATIYAQVYEQNVTEAAGAPTGITAAIGYGASLSDPSAGGWTWANASYNTQSGNNDEFQAAFTAPAAGTYSYTSRFTRDGVNWTYCDIDGNGSNSGLSFSTSQLGVLTVN